MRKNLFIFLFLFLSVQSNLSWAYDGVVHMKIDEYAVMPGVSQLDSVLKKQLGFTDGIETKLKKQKKDQKVWEWIAFGGVAEDYGWFGKYDYPSTRAFNHYHDPLKNWNEAGFDHDLKDLYFSNYLRFPVSAILWGLNPGQQDFTLNFTRDWSWGKAREYYYHALTGLTEEKRNEDFADCFRALGQVMHLLQDMSVPLHTRNDPHVFPLKIPLLGYYLGKWNYETYTKEYLKDQGEHKLDFIPDQPDDRPDPVLLTDPQPQTDPTDYSYLPSVSGLFDRNQYNEGDPIPSNNVIGLAEYSNANFLTEDTMWTYQHPKLSDTNAANIDWLHPESITAGDGETDNRVYIKKEKTVGDEINHFAAADYWTLEYYDHIDVIYSPFLLDKECWKDYAAKLIPRAVGYSAALLDYFFRGELEVELGDGEMKITNMSDETMHDGHFELYYDDEYGERQELVADSGTEVTTLDPEGEQTITFDPQEGAASYILVYRGALGNEIDAVVGKVEDVFKPYLLVTISYSGKQSRCFVWDIAEAQLAEIEDDQSTLITWPCDPDRLSLWSGDTISIGEQLYLASWLGETSDLECSCEIIPGPGDGLCCGPGRWSQSGSCSKTESRLSVLKDMDGSDLINTSYCFREDKCYSTESPSKPDRYCCHGTFTNGEEITMEAKKIDLFGSFRMEARNESGIVTTARTKKKYEFHQENHENETAGYCYEAGYSYFEEDRLAHTTYTFLTPLGALGETVLDAHNYYRDAEGEPGNGNWSQEFIPDSLSSRAVEGIYSADTIAQVYLYQYVKQIEERPDCGLHPYGWFPQPCDDPIVSKEERVVFVHAQVDKVNDGNTQNPFLLPRDESFENTIRDMVNDFYSTNGMADDEICKFSMNLDVRQ